jgi:hypothetical protein
MMKRRQQKHEKQNQSHVKDLKSTGLADILDTGVGRVIGVQVRLLSCLSAFHRDMVMA